MSASERSPTRSTIDAEYLAGKRFPYQEDIVAWSRTSTCMAATPGGDINWLEDVELLEEEGIPAVFDRYSNSFLKIYFDDPRGPRERDRPQGADEAPPVGQLVRHPAEGTALQVPAAPARAVGGGIAHGRAPTGSRRCWRAGRPRCTDAGRVTGAVRACACRPRRHDDLSRAARPGRLRLPHPRGEPRATTRPGPSSRSARSSWSRTPAPTSTRRFTATRTGTTSPSSRSSRWRT